MIKYDMIVIFVIILYVPNSITISGIALATYFLRLQIVIKKRGKRELEESWQEKISHNLEHVISATEKMSPKIISSVKSKRLVVPSKQSSK